MARPKDLTKAQTGMVTVSNVAPDGYFDLVNEEGESVGRACARVSKTHPGYVTLVMPIYTPVMRVPINWLDHLSAE